MTFQALPGFRDFPPDDLAFRAHILAAWRRVARRYGFTEYDGPPLEPLELYTAKSGDEIVGQLFKFTDKGDRAVALRPEMTPTFARMVSAHANAMRKPIRWFSVPQLFRYEKQQRGRLREHFQLNCDLVGESGPRADAEVIALAIDVCRELGLQAGDFRVRLSDRRVMLGLLAMHNLGEAEMGLAFAAIDKLERAGEATTRAMLAEGGLSPERIEGVLRVAAIRDVATLREMTIRGRPRGRGRGLLRRARHPGGDGTWPTSSRSTSRSSAGWPTTPARCSNSSTGRVSSGPSVGAGATTRCWPRSVGSTSPPWDSVSAMWCWASCSRIAVSGRQRRRRSTASWRRSTRPISPGCCAWPIGCATGASRSSTRSNSPVPKLGKQLKLAGARGARLAVVIGPDDRERGEVQLKDLDAKTQLAVPLDAVIERCREILSGTD